MCSGKFNFNNEKVEISISPRVSHATTYFETLRIFFQSPFILGPRQRTLKRN